MSNFEIYVKTSALGKTGIHWRRIESEEYQPIEKPSLILRQVIKGENSQVTIVNDLIDEVKPSLLIFRDGYEKKLLLEVTGIESPKRSDKLGRKVLNSIVWIAEDSEDNEEVLRKIAYSAIQTILEKDLNFSKMVEESIDFFELEEFRVDLDRISEFIQQIKSVSCSECHEIESYKRYQIESKSTDNLEKLAEEIRNYPLPKDWIAWDGSRKTDGVLVAVTDNLEKRDILHKAGVWRGFASRVEEPEGKKSLEKKTKTEPSVQLPGVGKSTPQPNQKIRLIIMLLILAITIVLILVSFKFLLQTQQTPQPTPTPQIQFQKEKTFETQTKQVLESQPIQTPQIQCQQEKTLESQTKQPLESQPQPIQTPQIQCQQEKNLENQTKQVLQSQLQPLLEKIV
ncbi:MAG: hypothetical protein KME60_06380 [Cyanomargarita calcarea GSE-NOS-MK-12-04C]|jgi:hypothetical protein|uniref:Uncharacterized protein n=1 Tax=Cyanomargarita calcarea GSE-NOS-MK-12-04C TaxID=2839659 RepID=A0A951QJZ3_9CYAN|nr:hypothetical protein [Cyanomargarita calcarea GSE-NOS-MK-12-04C]